VDRLFGTLELRAVNDEERTFTGIASTGALDAEDTIVEPEGARFTLPMPLLWQHDQRTPVGEITEAKLVDGQWLVKGSIAKVREPGKVKDATDQAWHSVKYKLVRGLSIGFQSIKKKGNRFIEWAWRELSLVTLPANQEATILSVRSAYLAASGDPKSPGVSGTQPNPRHGKMTNAERITQFENTRAAKVARKHGAR
jgi:HK97 family phage prohead protease